MPHPLADELKFGVDMDVFNNKRVVTEVSEDALVFTPKQHAKLLRKIDWHVLPLFALLYLLSFIDRTNIGNAKVAGMATDLNLDGLKYNIAAAVFFIPYCLGQIPSNIILKFIRPSLWLPSIMVAWGLVTTLICLVNTYEALIQVRIFLGLAESGLFPGMTYYVSLWYPRAERAWRIAVFTSAAIMGGAGSGFLAYMIEKMDGLGGLHGWQWIFCLEGIATVLAALSAPFFIYDSPETASFLTETERRYLTDLLKADSQGLAMHYNFQFVLQALKDYKIYLQCVLLLCMIIPGYAIALFTPTIINELGYSATSAQLLSIPPYIAGCASSILFAHFSDKQSLRGPYVMAGASIGLIGFALLYAQPNPGAAYTGSVFTALGVFPTIPIVLAWASANAGGDVKRGVAIAMTLTIGNLGGICASFIFFDPPQFHVGLVTIMGLLGFGILLSLFSAWDYDRINKQKETMCREHGITDGHEDAFTEKGDDSPLFRYAL